MNLERGCVVYSKAGRDQGSFLVIMSIDSGYAILSDGRERPIERPKRKNIRHIAATKHLLREEEMETNRSIRRTLAKLVSAASE